jgi:hypothetical protein
MKKIILLSLTFFSISAFYTQVGIGTFNPNTSAALDVDATNKGFLAPRIALISNTDLATIASPATGLMIYNTATAGTSPNAVVPGYYYYSGSKWERLVTTTPDATIEFNTVNPNIGTPTFTPNTPSSADYIYVSSVDASLWVWNGSTYVTFVGPSSTPFYIAGTTNDAGNNKTAVIARTGSLSIGSTTNYGFKNEIQGNMAIRALAGAVGTGTGIEMQTDVSSPRLDFLVNDGYVGQFSSVGSDFFLRNSLNNTGNIRFWTKTGGTGTERLTILNNGNIGINSTNPVSTLSNTSLQIQGTNVTGAINNGLNWSSAGIGFAGAFYSQSNSGNGLLVKIGGNTSANNAFEVSRGTQIGIATPLFNVLGNGNIGIGTSSPVTNLHVNNPLTATASVNANAQVLRLSRPTTSGLKWDNIAQFNLGSYSTAIAANSRLDLALTDGGNATTLTNVMTWLANGNVGINNTAPSAPLVVQGVTGTGVLKLISSSGNPGDNWWMGFGHSSNSTDANDRARIGVDILAGGSGRLFFTTGAPGFQTRALFIDESQRIGIGTSSPAAQLHTTGSVRFAGAGTPAIGKVLTSDASGNATWQSTAISTKTAAYTLTASDYGSVIVFNSSTNVVLTVPSTLSAGFYCQVVQQGTGQVSVIGASGVTVTSALGTLSRTTGSSIGILLSTSTNAFLSGDTSF